MIRLVVPVLLVIASLAGCGPGERGFACESDDQCVAGTLCITQEVFEPDENGEAQCVEGEKLCSNTCIDDEACAQFGDGLICVREGNVCAGVCLVGSSGSSG
jgi:hypothetical protein